jgi:serine/threonine protein kinase/tetratricopeptide (TPR) repeat protein
MARAWLKGETNIDATMTPELWKRLKPLYEAALDVPKESRAQFVADICKDDAILKRELERLLQSRTEYTLPLDNALIHLGKIFRENRKTLSDGQVVLDRFQIVRHLGSGGMGEVYEAEDLFLGGVHIALKTILPNNSGDPMMQKRLEREVLLAQEVTHPNLCPIHTIFHCDEPPPAYSFLTMKLLPGQTLAARLRDSSPLTNEDGLAVLRQAALGIAAIHAAGIIHRDIKPNNIMVDGSGSGLRLWITDFGLARAYETDSTALTVGAIAGTPGYIAPELFLGHPPSQASDLFALGVVLHEVFSGEKPATVLGTHSYSISPRLTTPKVPPLCVHLVTECLQENPQRRCIAFAEALKSIDAKLDPSHYTPRSRQFWTRRRFAATATVGVFAVAGGAWWKWDDIENALHPLPQKRFIALLIWPKTSDPQLTPMLTAALSAINSEFSRFEATDHDLFATSPEQLSPANGRVEVAQMTNLKQVCDALGANLVLAASALSPGDHPKLVLRILDPASGRSLRERVIASSLADITSLPRKAVEAAVSLLDLKHHLKNDELQGPGTRSSAAFTAFQAGDALVKQPNDSGLDAAIEKYKQAAELDPHYADAYAKLGLAYSRLGVIRHDSGAFDLARANCKRALALNPRLVDGHLAMASVLEQTGDQQAALNEISKALALDPADSGTLVRQGQIYRRLGRWEDAERTFQRVLTERPNNWMAYNELGVVLTNQGKYSEAIEKFRAACVAAPGSSLAFNNVGAIYLQLGNFRQAADYFRKSFSLRPNSLAALNTSIAIRTEGKATEALPFALKAVDLDPAEEWGWLELGDCYSSLPGRESAAKKAYLRGAEAVTEYLRINPSDGSRWMDLALYRAKTGKGQDAPALIQKAESLGAKDVDSQLCKARILETLGQRESALSTLKACFLAGATDFQVSSAPDLRELQRDPRYQQLLQVKTNGKKDAQ